MSQDTLNIALLGHRFMGRAHSNAWLQSTHFFDPKLKPVLKVACGRDEADLQAFADRWGWEEIETDWKKVIARDDIDVIDIALPTFMHAEVAIAAAEAGETYLLRKAVREYTRRIRSDARCGQKSRRSSLREPQLSPLPCGFSGKTNDRRRCPR